MDVDTVCYSILSSWLVWSTFWYDIYKLRETSAYPEDSKRQGSLIFHNPPHSSSLLLVLLMLMIIGVELISTLLGKVLLGYEHNHIVHAFYYATEKCRVRTPT